MGETVSPKPTVSVAIPAWGSRRSGNAPCEAGGWGLQNSERRRIPAGDCHAQTLIAEDQNYSREFDTGHRISVVDQPSARSTTETDIDSERRWQEHLCVETRRKRAIVDDTRSLNWAYERHKTECHWLRG